MKFTKMHGLGNDYVYVNCFEENIPDRSALAIQLSDRHFGVGSDGLICICPSEKADFMMDMYNADGSKSQMCGNGIRCVGKYVYDNKLTDQTKITVESGGEVLTLCLYLKDNKVDSVRVNMGKPVFRPARIPIAAEGDNFIDRPIDVLGERYQATCLSMGNPHAIIFVDDVDCVDLHTIGPHFEKHPLFPERVNTEFIQVVDDNTIRMRVWERGSGETMACGTGATASVVAGVLNEKCATETTVELLGGNLHIWWDKEDTGCVYMTGPATTVFEGEWIL